ncbi:MAG: YtxH domain-containing protein [Rhodothermales bacterium]|nr:YtxH domain-containing protein [Rhodothermales bacterium]
MPSDTRRVVRASVLSAVIGGLTGFGLGLLIAPDEGDKARRRVAYLLDRWTRQVALLVDRLRAEESESAARDSGAALVADARAQAERLLQDANTLMEEVRQRSSAA